MKRFKETDMKSLKKEPLTLNNISAETWLFSSIQHYEQKTLQVYDFILYANEATATEWKPLIMIKINSEYKQTRYSEQQMVDIWDHIVN